MKNFKFIYIVIALMTLSIVGCQDKTNVKEEVPNENISANCPIIDNTDKDEISNSVIAKRYKDIEKEDLTYEVVPPHKTSLF